MNATEQITSGSIRKLGNVGGGSMGDICKINYLTITKVQISVRYSIAEI